MKLNSLTVRPVVAMLALAFTVSVVAQDKEALKLSLPAPTLKGTPEDLPVGPNIEPLSDKPPVPVQIAKGAKIISTDKPVTTSVKPFTGELSQLTDGKKEAFDYDSVEMKKGAQWVQVDLGESFAIHAIAMWHDHRYIQVMHDVIVQVSDDPEFKTGVTTLFNNDTDNSAGLGVGTDREYFETHYGRVVEGKGTKARYVRGYTKGSTLSALNCWQELEVYGLPATKSGAAILPSGAAASGGWLAAVPVTEVESETMVAVESTREFNHTVTPAPTTTARSAGVSKPTPSAPINVNVETTANLYVSVEAAPATQTAPSDVSPSPLSAGLNWTTTLLAGLTMVMGLGVVYVLTRIWQTAPLTR